MIVLGNDGFDCIADQSVNDFTAKVDNLNKGRTIAPNN